MFYDKKILEILNDIDNKLGTLNSMLKKIILKGDKK